MPIRMPAHNPGRHSAIVVALTACALCSAFAPTDLAAQETPVGYQRPRARDTARTTPLRPSAPDDFGNQDPAADLPSVIPSDDPSAIKSDGDDPDTITNESERPAPKDGDVTASETLQLRDGIIDGDDPQGPRDGIDPTAIDTRSRIEAALFQPPKDAGDPLLLGNEDVDPINDRRIARLAQFEPYDPVGIKIGSFVFFPQLELGGNSYTNLFKSPRPRSDVSFDVRPSARLASNWSRHALEFSAISTSSFYNEFSTENEKAYTLEARGRLDITRRTSLQATISQDLSQESRSDFAVRSSASRPEVLTIKAALALNQTFNRLSLQMRGSVADISYTDSSSNGGPSINTRDYVLNEQAVRVAWEFKPTLSVFSETALNERDYRRLDANGIDRSSTGERYRVGVSFGTSGERLRGEISSGWGIQHPQARLPDVSGVLVDANLTWRATALTSLILVARSDFAETTLAGVSTVRAQAVGAEARHAIRRDLIATAGLSYTVSDYVGSSLAEDELRATLGIEYFLNRETTLFSKYTHIAFTSSAANADYDADELRVGVRIRR